MTNRSIGSLLRCWLSVVGFALTWWWLALVEPLVRLVPLVVEFSAYAVVGSGGHAGSVNENVAPRSGLFSAQIRPPCASTMERLIGSPIPIPLALVVVERLEHAR